MTAQKIRPDNFFTLPDREKRSEPIPDATTAPAVEQRRVVRLSGGGFYGGGIFWGMFWDSYGAYLGQEQENMVDGTPEKPFVYYLAVGNEAGQHGLTREEMEAAVEVEGDLPKFVMPPESK